MFKKILVKIIESRLKHRQVGKNITSSIWWFLGKKLQDKEEFDYVISKISKYWSKRNMTPQITDIIVLGKTIFVYVIRPGFMIGKYGIELDNQLKDINYNIKDEKIYDFEFSIIEDKGSVVKKQIDYKIFYQKYNM